MAKNASRFPLDAGGNLMKAHRIVGTLALASFFAITENSGEAVANRRPTPALGWQSIGPSPPAVEAPVAVDPV